MSQMSLPMTSLCLACAMICAVAFSSSAIAQGMGGGGQQGGMGGGGRQGVTGPGAGCDRGCGDWAGQRAGPADRCLRRIW